MLWTTVFLFCALKCVANRAPMIRSGQSIHDLHPEHVNEAGGSGPTNEDEERLVIDMFKGYNSLIRPLCNISFLYSMPVPYALSTPLEIQFGVAMVLLIGVDEKNQILQTNVWLTLKWNDCQFGWNPNDYHGLDSIRVPSERLWSPDIVLFNNADGNYEVSYRSNVVVNHKGDVTYVPPAVYKSSCRMDVEFFPFDEQTCQLIFGSWTYNSKEVQLKWYNNKKSVELEDYSPSGVLSADKSKMMFEIVIRRKTLFYTVILIIPTVLMAFLSMAVFFLPAECSEKITLGISILLALVVFLLLVSKILPPTSDTIPLMAKYLLLTFCLNIVSILVTVIIINVYFRSPTTHRMSKLVRDVFLNFLPRVLIMKRPERIPIFNGYFVEEYCVEEIFDASLIMPSITATILPFSEVGRRRNQPQYPSRHHKNCSKLKQSTKSSRSWSLIRRTSTNAISKHENCLPHDESFEPTRLRMATDELFSGKYTFGPSVPENCTKTERAEIGHEQKLSKELKTTVESIAFIAEHMKHSISEKKIRDDWKYVAMVIDRLLLIIFFGITFGGTVGIIFSAPHVFDFVDQQKILRRLIAESRIDSDQTCQSGHEEQLMIDLFRGYNNLVRPVPNTSSAPLEIQFSLAMVLLISVDEKNQIMHTNTWPTMRWLDYQMKWDPRKYGNIRTVRLPPDKVWLPDVVLFNNADGNYEVSFYSNVVVEHTGEMLWVPPAIYKSSCTIDVEFFPFDEQDCQMIFGSWTYNENEVVIKYLSGKRHVELNDYSESGIWDIMEVPGQLIQKKSKIAYRIRIRRKTLFYTVILIIPTVLMAFLSMMVFYLPAECSEKITLAISILLALVVFLLLVSKILPPTSSTIPLMAKYLLTTFCLNIVSIAITVVVVNIYFRGPTTHRMPRWVKSLFLRYLPLFLMMRRPESYTHKHHRARTTKHNGQETFLRHYAVGEYIEMTNQKQQVHHHPYCQKKQQSRPSDFVDKMNSMLSVEAVRAVESIDYITAHLKHLNKYKKIKEDWKYISAIVDRLLLYVFFAITVGGSMGILLSAPHVFEYVNQTVVIKKLIKHAEAEIVS